MKRKNVILAIILLSLASFTQSCKQNEGKKPTQEEKTTQTSAQTPENGILYSNLQDTESQNMVKAALISAGISAERAEAFLKKVKHFNESVAGKELVASGFQLSEAALPHYDEEILQTIWAEKNPSFAGYNCRITSYDLMRDLISVGKSAPKDQSLLFVDEESLKNSPEKVFSPQEEANFYTIYASVPTPMTKDVQTHLKSMQKAWQERGISFPKQGEKPQASMISVVKHTAITPEESSLFVGHIGVLLPLDGEYLFVEKLAFQAPYQATKFKTKKALADYLHKMYNPEVETDTALPLLMENNEMLRGEGDL